MQEIYLIYQLMKIVMNLKKTVNAFNNYIEYESKGGKDKTL